ncbi:hypothetical protein ACFSC4_27300 [Deinococcus malanensis]
MKVGDMVLRLDRQELRVALTPREFDLLSVLAQEPGKLFQRE